MALSVSLVCFGHRTMNDLTCKAEREAKAKMQEKAKRRELFAKQGKSLAKFSTGGTCVLRGPCCIACSIFKLHLRPAT